MRSLVKRGYFLAFFFVAFFLVALRFVVFLADFFFIDFFFIAMVVHLPFFSFVPTKVEIDARECVWRIPTIMQTA